MGRCKALALSSTPEIYNTPVHPRFVADKMWCEASLDVQSVVYKTPATRLECVRGNAACAGDKVLGCS